MAQRPCLFGVWCCILTTYTPHHHQALCEVTMSKEAVFTMKLESELREQFMAEADAAHRPASQVVRELMREFVQRQRQAREYDEFLQRTVEMARTSMRAGQGRSNDEVEGKFVAQRTTDSGEACGLPGPPNPTRTGPNTGN